MSTQYLLPCQTCGKELTISRGQAGQELTCGCGATVEAPTMRGFAELKTVETQAPTTARRPAAWGAGGQLMTLGAALAALGVGLAAYLHYVKINPTIDVSRYRDASQDAQIQDITPAESWDMWQLYKRGVYSENEFEVRAKEAENTRWRNLWLYVAAAGGVAFLAGAALSATNMSRPRE